MSALAIQGNPEARESIVALQHYFESQVYDEDQQAKCTLRHFYSNGMYAREMFIPASMCIVGKIHKHAHLNTISRGIIRVTTEFGADEYDATDHPCTFESLAGTKRAVYAVTDTVWTTYHAIDHTLYASLEELEKALVAMSYEEYERISYTDIKGYIA